MLTQQRHVRHERLQTERQKYKEIAALVASSLQDAEDEDETARRIQHLRAQVLWACGEYQLHCICRTHLN